MVIFAKLCERYMLKWPQSDLFCTQLTETWFLSLKCEQTKSSCFITDLDHFILSLRNPYCLSNLLYTCVEMHIIAVSYHLTLSSCPNPNHSRSSCILHLYRTNRGSGVDRVVTCIIQWLLLTASKNRHGGEQHRGWVSGGMRKFNIFLTFVKKLRFKPNWREHIITKQCLIWVLH